MRHLLLISLILTLVGCTVTVTDEPIEEVEPAEETALVNPTPGRVLLPQPKPSPRPVAPAESAPTPEPVPVSTANVAPVEEPEPTPEAGTLLIDTSLIIGYLARIGDALYQRDLTLVVEPYLEMRQYLALLVSED